MSTLYLGSDPSSLAEKLAEHLEADITPDRLFTPTMIVVPNRCLRKWLRMFLARRLDIAINLEFLQLEAALWKLLREVDPAQPATPPETIDENTYRLMVLAVLLEENDPHLAPLHRYLEFQGQPPHSQLLSHEGEKRSVRLSRLACRRAWSLADRLGLLIRDYEYARQDTLIQHWLKNEFGLTNASEFHRMMEKAQRALFRHITKEPDGRRALLNRNADKNLKTFPQYAMELMTLVDGSPSPPSPLTIGAEKKVVHFFGFTQICDLHAKTLNWLGELFDIRLYHLNVLISRFPVDGSLAKLADDLTCDASRVEQEAGRELSRLWGRAGIESLRMAAHCKFPVKHLPVSLGPGDGMTVLSKLRKQLLGVSTRESRVSQDTSLQIVACPGVVREVETVFDSIVYNLRRDPTLRQTDIAVLVTDMSAYRATLQSVFDRPQQRLQYNMVDYSAAGASLFGQAVLGIFELAMESFSRSRVFSVILNPCFLARLGVDRTQAMTWLTWAEELGIYQGWDAEEKRQQGYPRSPLYSWRLGLQRLRLGRFMDVGPDDSEHSAPRFEHVIPFADLASSDREHLDAFCRAVEGLLPLLARLRSETMSGARWGSTLTRLVQEFLDVPEDRPEEAQVRDQLLLGLGSLSTWDSAHDVKSAKGGPGMPLALVREYVLSQLELLPGSRGDYLVGGVTISAIEPMRPVPFPIVYVLGLGENLFPGSNAYSSFDLRGAAPCAGDIRPAEQRTYDFLATLLAAERKLYLFYNNRDLQKDQPFLPAVPLQQLQRFLSDHVVGETFQAFEIPANLDDLRYVDPNQPVYQDVLTQSRDADRCLALIAACEDNRLVLNKKQQAELAQKCREFQKDFPIPPEERESPHSPATIRIKELRGFLYLPAQESLRRHLRVDEDEESVIDDDEPLMTPTGRAQALMRHALQSLVRSAAGGDVQQALATWNERFRAAYSDARLRSWAPEEAFGEIDQAALIGQLEERIHGQGRIESFLRERASMTFCGPILLGEAASPIGAKLRFPALTLRPGHELPADAQCEIRMVGFTPFVWQSPQRLEILIVTMREKLEGLEISDAMLEPTLFYLALLANSSPLAGQISSQRWIEAREVAIHVAYNGGIQTWSHPPGSTTPAEALAYLVDLARDFLDPTQFDLLPLRLLAENTELRLAMHEDYELKIAADDYCTRIEDSLEEAREKEYGGPMIPPLVEMAGAKIPGDALDKVRRRFRLLDRGPARLRRQPLPKIPRSRKGAKS